jgi:hypothetical protein
VAQLTENDVLLKVISRTLSDQTAIRSLANRDTGRIDLKEGPLIDFKQGCDLNSVFSVQEIARDILGFSNSNGGLLLFGVSDDREILGHNVIEPRVFREAVGRFAGTRLSFRVGSCDVAARGKTYILPFVVIERASTAAPNLLQRDMEVLPQKAKKVKYRVGSLFYREDDQTKVEPPGDGLFERCLLLGFTYATPRPRSGLWLADDRPGFRIYDHINDRFVGREDEVTDLLAKVESPRVRGVSLAGMGGIGKTELAIELVLKLWKSAQFKSIYSGTAKNKMMTPLGTQNIDPMFEDYTTFIADLSGWLGFEHPVAPSEEEALVLETRCLSELKSRPKTLLFVDNLETVKDTHLFKFLDDRLPDSVTLITTSRVHKLGGGLVLRTVEPLSPRAAGKLLRHELQRQGLDDFADTAIEELEQKSEELYKHPLAIRWFAWACGKDRSKWKHDSSTLFLDQSIELFCVDHTLKALPASARKVISAIAALQDQIDMDATLIAQATSLPLDVLEKDLWDLQCSGLVISLTEELDGKCLYSVVPLAVNASRELGRRSHWESGFAKACLAYTKENPEQSSDDPLLTDLSRKNPRDVKYMTAETREELRRRIERVKPKKMSVETEVVILQLEAECYRHSESILTARDIYSHAAEKLLSSGLPLDTARHQDILVEAATVLRQSGPVATNLKRAVRYLEPISSFATQEIRVLAMLAEMYAMLGNQERYTIFYERGRKKLEAEGDLLSYRVREAADNALGRAEAIMDGR